LANEERSTLTKTPSIRLRAIRESAGLSRRELAKRAGVALSHVYLIEDNLSDPRISTLLKLASALKVPAGSPVDVVTGLLLFEL
jgi:transcriptional regulator with XRE-family HTH domain